LPDIITEQQREAMTTINGTNAADTLTGTTAGDVISGGNGNDLLSGDAGNDVLSGGNGNDSLLGSDGNDTLSGGNGDDLLDGGAGTDIVSGENGNDVAVYAMSENAGQSDVYDGGNGVDTLRLVLTQSQANSAAVQADIQAYRAFLALHNNGGFQFTAFDLTARNFELLDVVVVPGGNLAPIDIDLSNAAVAENSAAGTVVGALTASDPDAGDTLTFTLVDDAGGRFAIDGANLVVAGPLDFETSTSHQVTVRVTDAAGAFHDETFTIGVGDVAGLHLVGDANPNTLDGGPEDDLIEGRGGDDRLTGGAGNDLLNGGNGIDTVRYRETATGPLTINLAAGTVSGGGIGSDTLRSIESVGGSNFADLFDATGFSATSTNAGNSGTRNGFQGNGGDDIIIGNGFTQLSFVNATGGVTVDLIAGTADGDASVGHDTLSGVNSATGSNFNDVLLGTNGGDFLDGRAGDDFIDGRGGFFDQARYGDDTATTSGITVNLADGIVSGDASIGTDTLRSIEGISLTRFDDIYDATGFSGSSLNAGGVGTFNIFSGGQGGNDVIIGNGDTQLNYGSLASGVTINFTTGIASYGASQDTFSGVDGVFATNFADQVIGDDNRQEIQTVGGNDIIFGQGGFDTISSGDGADTINGGAGTDTLLGGSGNDTFIFAPGNEIDRINDFVSGAGTEDRVDLTAFADIHSLADLQITDNGTETFIDFGNGDQLVFAGVHQFHQDDFLCS
jgi:Ca2+-binding RTX toxin-like protein